MQILQVNTEIINNSNVEDISKYVNNTEFISKYVTKITKLYR